MYGIILFKNDNKEYVITLLVTFILVQYRVTCNTTNGTILNIHSSTPHIYVPYLCPSSLFDLLVINSSHAVSDFIVPTAIIST